MLQKIFTRHYLTILEGDLAENLSYYESEDVWIPEAAETSRYEIDSRIEIDGAFSLKLPQKGNLYDLENSKLVFEALRGLTRSQAADSRLWTYLTHISCWGYMRARWQPSEKFINDALETRREKLKTYVLEHYFVRSEQSRALIRNGMARLWWYSFLTYDENRDNPYELTSVLLKNLDIAKNVLERNLGRNKTVLHSVLEFLLDKEDLLSGGDAGRSKIRRLIHALNLQGGHSVLDNLNKRDIQDFLLKHYNQIKNSEQDKADDLLIDELFDELISDDE